MMTLVETINIGDNNMNVFKLGIQAVGDARFNNQKIFCEKNHVPMFANRYCSHDVLWGDDGKYKDKHEDIWAAYITDVQSISEHILACPVCHKSFCD